VQLVQDIERLKKRVGWPYRRVCSTLGVKYSSYMRWKDRQESGESILEKPGPDTIEPLNISSLYHDILGLSHGEKRTHDTGALYEKYRAGISRRELRAFVKAIRREIRREEAMMMRRIDWKTPGIIWSVDDTGCKWDGNKELNMVEDLGSKYKLKPLAGEDLASGKSVAGHMEWLFETYGAPLFMKRDNHGNLNNQWVDDVLNRYLVIPLNSPAHYAPYNGAMERSQGEIKRQLADMPRENFSDIQTAGELAAHDLNHKARRSLNGHTACERFSGRKKLLTKYDRRRRKEVFEEIRAMAVEVVKEMGLKTAREADNAWRLSVETWLQRHGYITVSRNGKVLPYLP
jgi:hypothetical protein